MVNSSLTVQQQVWLSAWTAAIQSAKYKPEDEANQCLSAFENKFKIATPEKENLDFLSKRKLILKNFQSPGDIVMLTACVRDLHKTHPGKFITDVRTPCSAIWENNPYITKIADDDPNATIIDMQYPLIHQSNSVPYHFIHGFRKFLSDFLNVKIKCHDFCGDIHLTGSEKSWNSQVSDVVGKDGKFWIIDAGSKKDFTAKQWEIAKFQKVVESFPNLTFVQVGSSDANHIHQPLFGSNVINLIGKTDMRQLIRLVYNSYGVITPVSLPMHLAAAVEVNEKWGIKSRPCIVIAGGREPSSWEAYTNHQYLHTCGMLDCCSKGGCWKSRTVPLGDGDSKDKDLCKYPIKTASGQYVPKCLDMITAEDVIDKIRKFI